MSSGGSARERARIRAEYARRDADPRIRARDAADAPWTAFIASGSERALRALLADHSLLPLGDRRILEVGCGSGGQLARLARFGARPERLAGVDVVRARLRAAREALPGSLIVEADATELPFATGAFDLVAQFTMLSSILDPAVRAAAAAEMRRVLAPGGAIVSYDLRVARPGSPTRGVTRAELIRLFGEDADVRSVTLAPPIARALAGRAPRLAALLERAGPLRTHHLGLFRPRA